MAINTTNEIQHIEHAKIGGVEGKKVFIIGTDGSAINDFGAKQYATQVDEVGTVTYIGEANPGTATSAASWRIKKVDSSSDPDVSITWADGNSDFDNIWDNRLSLSYS